MGKIYLVTERYIRHRLAEECGETVKGKRWIAVYILSMKGFPKPYYSRKQYEALHLAAHLYEYHLVNAFWHKQVVPYLERNGYLPPQKEEPDPGC